MGFEYRRLLVYRKVLAYRVLAAPPLVRIKLVDVDLYNQLKRNATRSAVTLPKAPAKIDPKSKQIGIA